MQGINQYAPISGRPELRAAIAEHQQHFYGQILDPETQVLVTAGASEAISATVAALVQPGDEVVVFEPYYDIYPAAVALAGGTVRTVPLTAPEFAPQPEDLAQAFSDKTRLVIVNDPHTPTGTVFSRETLQEIVQLAQEHHALILQDGVYEHLVFEPTRFTPIFTVEGAAERPLLSQQSPKLIHLPAGGSAGSPGRHSSSSRLKWSRATSPTVRQHLCR